MMACSGKRGIAPFILDLSIRWGDVVSLIPQPFTASDRAPNTQVPTLLSSTNKNYTACTYIKILSVGIIQRPGKYTIGEVKGKMHPCTGTETLYRQYGP